MLRWFLWIVLALLTYVSALLYYLPAGWLWQWLAPRLVLPADVRVDAVTGRLWQGQVMAHWAQQGFTVHWALKPGGLVRGELPLALSLRSAQARVDGVVAARWPDRWHMTIEPTRIDMQALSMFWQEGVTLDGQIQVDGLTLAGQGARWSLVEGQGGWSGGRVTWPMGSEMGEASMPPLQARIQTQQDQVQLHVKDAQSAAPSFTGTLAQDGWLQFRVHRRLLDLTGQRWGQASSTPETVIFQMRHRVPLG